MVGPDWPLAHVMWLPMLGSRGLPRILMTLLSATKASMPQTVEQFRHTLVMRCAVL
jgi:hypothetical protein